MTLSTLLLGLWLILVGVTWIGWVPVSSLVLGAFALVTGVVILIDSLGSRTVFK